MPARFSSGQRRVGRGCTRSQSLHQQLGPAEAVARATVEGHGSLAVARGEIPRAPTPGCRSNSGRSSVFFVVASSRMDAWITAGIAIAHCTSPPTGSLDAGTLPGHTATDVPVLLSESARADLPRRRECRCGVEQVRLSRIVTDFCSSVVFARDLCDTTFGEAIRLRVIFASMRERLVRGPVRLNGPNAASLVTDQRQLLRASKWRACVRTKVPTDAELRGSLRTGTRDGMCDHAAR